LESPEVAFGVRVPVAQALPPGEHRVQITAQRGAAIDGFIVQSRPTWWLRRGVGALAVVVGLAVLGWLFVARRA
jgi:hypothetical protein